MGPGTAIMGSGADTVHLRALAWWFEAAHAGSSYSGATLPTARMPHQQAIAGSIAARS